MILPDHLTAHGAVRYIERAYGLELPEPLNDCDIASLVRAEASGVKVSKVIDRLSRPVIIAACRLGAAYVLLDGVRLVIKSGRIVTALEMSHALSGVVSGRRFVDRRGLSRRAQRRMNSRENNSMQEEAYGHD